MVTVRIEQLNFLKKGVSCSIAKYYTHTKDHCLNCLFNDPIGAATN